jgi:hypothetical protein
MRDNADDAADPADGEFRGIGSKSTILATWPAVLAGFYLGTSLTNKRSFPFPMGSLATIPPSHGYFLVWADGEASQNKLESRGPSRQFSNCPKAGEAVGIVVPPTARSSISFRSPAGD